ncbi:MAG: substrate-binding domain-containing protein [Actinomycetota bacterium]|nr:substrate-binding domain-containing protein [Actinomycetota bacterium]
MVADAADPFYLQMKCGAEQSAKANHVALTWQGSTSVDVAPEIATLNAVRLRKPQGIILAPFDPNAFIAPVKSLMASGTPVVTVDGSLAKKVELENVRTDNAKAGALAADALGAQIHGTGTVGVISFSPSVPVEVARVTGFVAEMKKVYPNVKILAAQYGGADAGKAATITSGLIQANPNLAGLYVTDANDAEGAASAVRGAGDLGKVKVVGYDATPQEVQDLKAGLFSALVAQKPYQEGYRAVEVMANYLRHKLTRAQIPYYFPTGAAIVTKANVNSKAMQHVLYRATCS